MNTDIRVLIVDDEEDIIEFLSYNLKKEGYNVETAYNGMEAIKIAKSFNPHLIVLDIMMPEYDGIEVCDMLRSDDQFNNTIIAFLTARNESFTQVTALETGGDDFINKPIKPNVFKSRIKALLRRHPDLAKSADNSTKVFGSLEINFDHYKLTNNGVTINLAKKEFDLLALLASKPGKVFKRAEIMSKVWGSEVIVGDRTIDVHIRKLREKLGSHYIHTLKGVGYKFEQ
ncbi:MAG: two-component system alkaline phosphatase synthesis response regulator PhoP [Saprospiraceae bacterium]|jgi:two-component system alkaline phosphatase synthesis response regulator PhoP